MSPTDRIVRRHEAHLDTLDDLPDTNDILASLHAFLATYKYSLEAIDKLEDEKRNDCMQNIAIDFRIERLQLHANTAAHNIAMALLKNLKV